MQNVVDLKSLIIEITAAIIAIGTIITGIGAFIKSRSEAIATSIAAEGKRSTDQIDTASRLNKLAADLALAAKQEYDELKIVSDKQAEKYQKLREKYIRIKAYARRLNATIKEVAATRALKVDNICNDCKALDTRLLDALADMNEELAKNGE